jgi:type IV secretion system protein VirB11
MSRATSISAKFMKSDPASPLVGDETIRALGAPLLDLINSTVGITEVCMSEPGVFFIMIEGRWERVPIPIMDRNRCERLVEAVSYYVRQEIKEESPLLSTALPTGERLQVVIPPACDPSQLILQIRVPDRMTGRSLESYRDQGIFSRFRWVEAPTMARFSAYLEPPDRALIQHLKNKDLFFFLREAVIQKKTIAVIGDTGSGKTTLMKALCRCIPTSERLVTIEDSRELLLPDHPNTAHLLYAKGGQAANRATPGDLIAACMRLRPDRVLLAELRGSEAWDFLKLMTTGHAGSITSFHAESCGLAHERWALMAKEHQDAASASSADIKRLVSLTVDIFVHITARTIYSAAGVAVGVDRYVTEVAFDPTARLAQSVSEGGRLHGRA